MWIMDVFFYSLVPPPKKKNKTKKTNKGGRLSGSTVLSYYEASSCGWWISTNCLELHITANCRAPWMELCVMDLHNARPRGARAGRITIVYRYWEPELDSLVLAPPCNTSLFHTPTGSAHRSVHHRTTYQKRQFGVIQAIRSHAKN